MNLTYKQRMELIEIVKQAKLDLWEDIVKIDNKFKIDTNMLNDKKAYWAEQQDNAYAKKELLDGILFELNDSI
jgi:hypothetical protein